MTKKTQETQRSTSTRLVCFPSSQTGDTSYNFLATTRTRKLLAKAYHVFVLHTGWTLAKWSSNDTMKTQEQRASSTSPVPQFVFLQQTVGSFNDKREISRPSRLLVPVHYVFLMKTLLRLADLESGPPVTQKRTKYQVASSTSTLCVPSKHTVDTCWLRKWTSSDTRKNKRPSRLLAPAHYVFLLKTLLTHSDIESGRPVHFVKKLNIHPYIAEMDKLLKSWKSSSLNRQALSTKLGLVLNEIQA